MSDELRFKDVKIGDTIANRYVLESVVNADNGEAATFMCNYDGWICRAKIFYDDKMPDKEVLAKQRKVSSSHLVKKMDQNVYNNHIYQIMPNFNGNIMSKPVNDKILLEMLIPGVVEALKAIHAEGIIHGHIKPTNIFYSPMGDDILLGDFGVSLEHIGDCSKNISMNYLPPEVQNGVYDEKADYYSLGVSIIQLITGKNPFEGMNKRVMLKTASTIEYTLPPKVHPLLQKIIRGLTVKDHDTRWGAEEVERALAQEEVEVVDNFVYVPPVNELVFGENKYTDMASLAVAFASDWNEAVATIRSEKFAEFVEGLDEETAQRVNGIVAENDDNKAVFNLIYAFNSDLPFYWKGTSFTDFNSFADEMKRADDKEIYKQILADGAWSDYLRLIGADDDALSNIDRLCDDARNGMDAAVLAFKIDYLLSGQYVYMLDAIPFTDVNTLISYIQMNVAEVKELCHEFINDARFFAWLEILGYGAQVAEWRAEIG